MRLAGGSTPVRTQVASVRIGPHGVRVSHPAAQVVLLLLLLLLVVDVNTCVGRQASLKLFLFLSLFLLYGPLPQNGLIEMPTSATVVVPNS